MYTVCMHEINRKRHRNPLVRLIRSIFFGFVYTILAVVGGVLAVALIYYYLIVPDVGSLLKAGTPASTKIYDRNGGLLYEVYGEAKRTPVPFSDIPIALRQGTIAIEDKNFYNHGALSLNGLVRAVLVNYQTGEIKQGASTITQQFIKNALLTSDRTFQRKALEAVLAQKLESHYSKDEILNLYLNTIPYGRNAYGVEAAAQTYFGKPAKQLTLAESAYLAALPQAPSLYNPLGPNRATLDERKNTVLALMLQQGYITQLQFEGARDAIVTFQPPKVTLRAPHFVFWVQNYIAAKYGDIALREGGLKVYTTLDPKLQELAEKVVVDGAAKTAIKYGAHNAALVAIDPKTQQVLAMVGSKNYFGDPEPRGCKPGKNCTFEPDVNVAVAERQPGSSFKIYDYATAFQPENAYSPASVLYDIPSTFGGNYSPRDYDGGYRGRVAIRSALAGSLNIPAVQITSLVGADNVVTMAHNMGVTSPLANCGLAVALGSCEVRLVDHVSAASVIANAGKNNGETPILKIEDKDGKTLEQYRARQDQVIDTQGAYELTNIMSDNKARTFIFGDKTPLVLDDGTPAKNNRPAAAKTGTTQNWHDAWTIGFTPSLAAGVWAGNNDGTLLYPGSDGVFAAAPIWHDFMEQALKDTPVEDFQRPPGIKELKPKDVPAQIRNKYIFKNNSEIFADYAIPKLPPPLPPKPKPAPEQQLNATAPLDRLKVAILEPAPNAPVIDLPLTVKAAIAAADGVKKVDLYIDGQFIRSISDAPYRFMVQGFNQYGFHTITIQVTDWHGQVSSTDVPVQYINPFGAPGQ